MIQQLQEELNSLRQRSAGQGFDPQAKGGHGPEGSGSDSVSELRGKLHQAAKYIAQLAKEKQQLLDLSNKLRAELKEAGRVIIVTGNSQSCFWRLKVRYSFKKQQHAMHKYLCTSRWYKQRKDTKMKRHFHTKHGEIDLHT